MRVQFPPPPPREINMIYTDLDGILRELHLPVFGKVPDSWYSLNNNKQNLVDYINQHMMILCNAKKTQFCDKIYGEHFKKYDTLHIISHQHKHWIKYTDIWINNNLKKISNRNLIITTYTNSSNEKLKYLSDNDILIDDSPLFSDYSKIALIVYKYNEHILEKHKPYYVIRNVEDITKLYEKYHKNKICYRFNV